MTVENYQTEFSRLLESGSWSSWLQAETPPDEGPVEKYWGDKKSSLERLSEPQRRQLLVGLIREEMQFRRRLGARCAADEFALRFAQFDREFFEDLIRLPELPRQQTLDTNLPARYHSLKRIGAGGIGVVWRVRDDVMQRTVAIKVLQPAFQHDESARQKLELEAQLTGRLQHPGIPPVYERGLLANGSPYFAMKLVDGQTLAERLAKLPAEHVGGRSLGMFHSLVQTIAYAHNQNLIHRDLKPDNIMVGAFGEVQVMDWGLARHATPVGDAEAMVAGPTPAVRGTVATGLASSTVGKQAEGHAPTWVAGPGTTREGDLLGTPAFMAPEQARGDLGAMGTHTDVFSLGVILFEWLAGKRMHGKATTAEILDGLRTGRLPDIRSKLESMSVPIQLVEICCRCCAVDPAERFSDASGLAEALSRYEADTKNQQQQLLLEQKSMQVRWVEQRKRARVRWTAALLVLAVSIVGTVVSLVLWQMAQSAAQQAKAESEQRQQTSDINSFLVMDFLGQSNLFGNPERNLEVQSVLDQAAMRVEAQFAERPRAAAEIRGQIATGYARIGEYRKALQQTQMAYDISRALNDAEDLSWTMHRKLAKLHERLGNSEAALELINPYIEYLENQDPLDADDWLEARGDRGQILGSLGRMPEAEKEISEVLELLLLQPQPNRLAICSRRVGWASYLVELGRYEQAQQLLDTAATEFEGLGVDLDQPLRIQSELVAIDFLVYLRLRAQLDEMDQRLESAERCYRQAMELSQQFFGNLHHRTLSYADALAQCLIRLERWDEAEALLSTSIAGLSEALGEQHDESNKSRNSMAALFVTSGNFEAAEQLLLQIREQLIEQYPDGHYDLTTNRNNLGSLYLETERLELAAAEFQLALEENRQTVGSENPRTIITLVNLAKTRRRQGELDLAESLYREALQLSEKLYPPHHPETLRTIEDLVMMLQVNERGDKAEPLLRKLLVGQEQSLGRLDPRTMLTRLALAYNLKMRKQLVAAHAFFIEAGQDYLQQAGIDHQTTLPMLVNAGRNALEADDEQALDLASASQLLDQSVVALRDSDLNASWRAILLRTHLADMLVRRLTRGECPVSAAERARALMLVSENMLASDDLAAEIPAARRLKLRRRIYKLQAKLAEFEGNPVEAQQWRDRHKALQPDAAEFP